MTKLMSLIWQDHWPLFTIIAFLGLAGSLVLYVGSRQYTYVWTGSCKATGLKGANELEVECNGKRYSTNEPGLTMSYAINPGPILSSINYFGNPTCERRPFK